MGTSVSGSSVAGSKTAIDDINTTNAAKEAVDAAKAKAKFEKAGRDGALELI